MALVPSTRGTVIRPTSVGRKSGRMPQAPGGGLQALGRGLQRAGARVEAEAAKEEAEQKRAAAEALRLKQKQDRNEVRRTTDDLNTTLSELTANAESDPNMSLEIFNNDVDAAIHDAVENLPVNDPEAREEFAKNMAVAKRRNLSNFTLGLQNRIRREEVATKAAAVENLSVRMSRDSDRLLAMGGETGEWIRDHETEMKSVLNDATQDMNKESAAIFTRGFIANTAQKLVSNMVAGLDDSPNPAQDVDSIKNVIDSFTDLDEAQKAGLEKMVDSQVNALQRQQKLAQRNAQNQYEANVAKSFAELDTQLEKDKRLQDLMRNDPLRTPLYKKIHAQFEIDSVPSSKREADQVINGEKLSSDDKLDRLKKLFNDGKLSTQDFTLYEGKINKALQGVPQQTLKMLNQHLDFGIDRDTIDKTSLGKNISAQNTAINAWAEQLLAEDPNMTFDQLKKVLGESLSASDNDKALISIRRTLRPGSKRGDLESFPVVDTDREALQFTLEEAKTAKKERGVTSQIEKGTPALTEQNLRKMSDAELNEARKKAFGK